MGCAASSSKPARAPPVDHVPDPGEIAKTKFLAAKGEPMLVTDEANDLSSSEATRFVIKKSNKSSTGDAFRVKVAPEEGVGDWLGENGVYVQPAKKLPGIRRSMEDLSCVYRGKDESMPLAYWVADVSRGVNNFKILRDRPIREGQPPTQFKGAKKEELYHYAQVVFDLDTTVVSVSITGQKRDDPPFYQLRQANSSTWIVYRYSFSEETHQPCATFAQEKGYMKGFPAYEVNISPGIDPILIICLTTLTDSFWQYHLKKAMVKFY